MHKFLIILLISICTSYAGSFAAPPARHVSADEGSCIEVIGELTASSIMLITSCLNSAADNILLGEWPEKASIDAIIAANASIKNGVSLAIQECKDKNSEKKCREILRLSKLIGEECSLIISEMPKNDSNIDLIITKNNETNRLSRELFGDPDGSNDNYLENKGDKCPR